MGGRPSRLIDRIAVAMASRGRGDQFFFANRPCVMSALPPKADIRQHDLDVGFVPLTDSCAAAISFHWSITSSARTSNEGGMVIPSALAVFKFTTKSNSTGCSTGMSAGFVPLSTLSM
jgi:hypothetical protein